MVCFFAKASFHADLSVGISSRALSELDLLREPLSVAAHTAREHVRELESFGVFSCLKTKHVYGENAPSQVTDAGESTSTPTDMRQLPRKGVKNEWKDEQTERAADILPTSNWPRHGPIFIAPSWFNAPLALGLPAGAGLDYCRNESLYRGADIERYRGPKRSLPLRGLDVLVQDVLPTAAHTTWPLQNWKYLRVKEIHGPDQLVSHDLTNSRNAGLCALRLSVTSWPPLTAQCSCSNVFTTCHFQPWAWIVWVVWWLNGSRCTNGSSFSPS